MIPHCLPKFSPLWRVYDSYEGRTIDAGQRDAGVIHHSLEDRRETRGLDASDSSLVGEPGLHPKASALIKAVRQYGQLDIEEEMSHWDWESREGW